MHKPLLASLALALVTPGATRAQAAPATPTELSALRQKINALRAVYETCLQALKLWPL